MKTYKYFAPIILLILLIGCNKPQEDILATNNFNSDVEIEIAQERNANYPFSGSDAVMAGAVATRVNSSDEVSLGECLGRSFKLKIFPYENLENMGFPVIDVNRFKMSYPNHYQSTPVNTTDSYYKYAANFNRLESVIGTTKMFAAEAEANVFMVKATYKQTLNEVFSKSTSQINQDVFAEASICYSRRKYEISTIPLIQDTIIKNYIHETFYYDLYHSSVKSFYNNYGECILLKFNSGGKAIALYKGVHKEASTATSITKEKDIKEELGVKIDNIDGSTSITIGNGSNSSSSSITKFTELLLTVKTLGGLPVFSQFTSPENINSASFDLTNWCASLERSENLGIAVLPQESLLPIVSLIEEDNLKEAMNNLSRKGWANIKNAPMLAPRIEVCLAKKGLKGYTWETRLRTRYGEYVIMKNTPIGLTQPANYDVEEIARVKQQFPYLEVVKTLQPRIVVGEDMPPLGQPEQPYNFDFRCMSTLVDHKTGKIYLIPTNQLGANKVAYTLYDQRVVDDYIFQNHIADLPGTLDNLDNVRKNYRLIAL